MSEKKYTKAQLQQVFKMLLAKPSNKRCADCPAKVPRWYSCNLGVFLCINCAGFHRGLGTHITFVQSFNLDTPKLKDLKTLKKWGNARGNAYWQAKAKKSDLPTPADCDINSKKLKQFITDKYERRRWVASKLEPEEWLKQNGGKEPAATKSVKKTKAKQQRKVKSKPVAKPAPSPAPAMTFQKADADPFGFGSLAPAPAPTPAPAPAATSAPDDLLSAFGDFGVSSTSAPAAPAPAPVASALDIDSLYASAAPAPAPSTGMSGMSALGGLGSGWDMNAMAPAAAPRQQPTHQQQRGVPMAAQYQMGARQQYAQPQYGYQQQQQQYAYQQQQRQRQQYGAGGMGFAMGGGMEVAWVVAWEAAWAVAWEADGGRQLQPRPQPLLRLRVLRREEATPSLTLLDFDHPMCSLITDTASTLFDNNVYRSMHVE